MENITYAKVTKANIDGIKAFRLETRDVEFLDDWSTLEADFATKAEAIAAAEAKGYILVPSWQAAFRMEGMNVIPRTTLLYV